MEAPNFKKPANKKALLGMGVLLFIVFVIAISSFFPFIVDPSGWQTMDFLTRELIIVVITISAMVTSMFIGQAKNAEDPRSELAKAKVRFAENKKRIKDRSAFRQWVKDVLEPQDKQLKKERLMERNGLAQDIFSLEISEIEALVGKPQKYGDVFYHAITKEQKDFALRYKSGKYAIDYVPADYYLTVSSINNDKTRSEKAGGETKTKTALLSVELVSKIVRGLIIAMTFASLVYDATKAESDAQKAQMWINFASRMMALVTSAFSGYLLGSKQNDVEADYINMRCDVQDDFLCDKDFVAKDDQELAKQEYIERVKEENVMQLPPAFRLK